ncbi:tyrosine-type recombinase/integrase [Nonomuraea polychroma]|uniref:tyrosine-type recombinase/integrase n=1 Tax=Nonomuraea polychroma TaxID=46176 RepID=UPI003D8FC6AD
MAWAEKRGNSERPWRVKYMGGKLTRSGFATKQEALDWGRVQEAEARARRWNDPRKGDITVAQWIIEWSQGQDLAETTVQNYTYMIRAFILPHFGDRALSSLDALEIQAWEKGIRARGYAPSVAAKARSVFGTILGDAETAKRLASNPARKRRGRGRQDIHAAEDAEESLWLTEFEVLSAAERASMISGRPDEFVEIVLRAYTGMRGGEIRGLERKYCKLGSIRVECQLREVDGVFIKAPPKHNSRRTIPLPPFLTALMSDHVKRVPRGKCDCHGNDYVFRAQGGPHLGRTNFANRYFRPAVDGLPVPYKDRPRLPLLVNDQGRLVIRRGRVSREWMEDRAVACWRPLVEGATPHDLRHSHKTWMIGDGVPQVAQYERLGHKMAGIDRIYSHVAPEFRQQLLDGMQKRWERSLRARARKGPSSVPVLQALLEPYLGPWELSSQIPPIGGATILTMQTAQAV